ncbi:MAG: hypothetical protein Q8N53_22490 [Longimicrobiales bacterium]|nr:hypothetical protein [Longimicrobiales bacterium]
MSSSRAPRWLPPFIVGLCAATAAEVAVGLLLYGGPGLVRSLTAVLAVEAAALGVGLWTSPGARPDIVEALRRRWLFCLVAFLVAMLFSAFWSVVEALGGTALGQGLGLAFLAALPLYAVGGVVGAMGAAAEMAAVAEADPGGRARMVGGPAALGGALGFAVTGTALPQAFTPASLLLVCLMMLSLGGMLYGSILEAQVRVHVRARRPSGLGEVRVEDRHLLSLDRAARALLEGDHVRRWTILGEPSEEPWDVSAFNAIMGPGDDSGSVLLVGGGASALPRSALRERPSLRVEVLERSLSVVELGREHLETGPQNGADGRMELRVGNLEDVVASPSGPYDLVMLDTAALEPQGGMPSLSSRFRASVVDCVSPQGFLVLGPSAPPAGIWAFPEGWSQGRYARRVPPGIEGLGLRVPAEEVLWVGSPSAVALPEVIGAFARVPGAAG